ncbi:hypothetical protein IW492_05720 [Enterococcus sp. BWB1-3]|uniref:hypothetical protein n=1 Tax=Enterococcus sp. BWB1-3 TaxID=2787713 RepID=UPI0019246A49|nr:hypothetical protein [Enterococcus sp. BWB1-3]MBL1228730.1 hypothetical protein [Enterococcus sp. BWB1-3]
MESNVKGYLVTTEDDLLIADINLHEGKIIEVDGYKVVEYTDENQLLFREQNLI